MIRTPAQRLEAETMPEPNTGCLLWTGPTDRKGYGIMSFEGSTRRAHREAWSLAYGIIPVDMHVCHRCDNPPCCNPAHLFLGTTQENTADKVAKGRQARGSAITRNMRFATGLRNGMLTHPEARTRGERHPCAKLTADIVRDCRRRSRAGETASSLAREFGIAPRSMIDVIKGKTWACVPFDPQVKP